MAHILQRLHKWSTIFRNETRLTELDATLFKTFSNNIDRRQFELNVVNNWSWLDSNIYCVDIATSTKNTFINDASKKMNRKLTNVSKLSNQLQLLIVKYLYFDAMKVSNTDFYNVYKQ